MTGRRRLLDEATRARSRPGNLHTEAATRMGAWLSGELPRPTGNDFAMVRLFLPAFLRRRAADGRPHRSVLVK